MYPVVEARRSEISSSEWGVFWHRPLSDFLGFAREHGDAHLLREEGEHFVAMTFEAFDKAPGIGIGIVRADYQGLMVFPTTLRALPQRAVARKRIITSAMYLARSASVLKVRGTPRGAVAK